jgi:hypothetical protein
VITVPQIAGLTHHHQQRAALCGQLLADGRDVADAAAPAAVLLGMLMPR